MCRDKGYKPLYLPFNFIINLKLLFKKIIIAKKGSKPLSAGLNRIVIFVSCIRLQLAI